MDSNSILTIIGIISPFILSAVWMTTLITKISNRALLLEVSTRSHENRLGNLENSTSYASIEKVVEKVCYHIFNSKEFKESMRDSVKETILHVERNRTVESATSLTLVLEEIKMLHADIKNK